MKKRTARGMLVAGMTLGVVMLCGPFFGAIASLIRLNQSLAEAGINDPQHLSVAVGPALSPMAFGLFLCPMGLMVLIICIFLWRRTTQAPQTDGDSPPASGE